MITERINRGILLGFLVLFSSIVIGQGYPENGQTAVFNSTEMVNEDLKVITMDGCLPQACAQQYKNINLMIDFSLANDFADISGAGPAIEGEVDVIITANKCAFGVAPYTLTQHLEIDTDNPRQFFQLDFTSVYLTLDDIEITVDNYVVPVGYESSVKLVVGYEGDFLFPVGGKTIEADNVNDVDLITSSAKNFVWTVDCGHYAMYEFQLLKLENHDLVKAELNDPQDVIVNVDWSKALSIHTYSWQKDLRLTLTEGTGYYTWRVRGIGNEYSGGEANPLNWDVWSTHVGAQSGFIPDIAPAHTFYYEQFDEDKNWNYSRVFIEGERDYAQGVRIGEQIGYASGLLHAKQSQSIINTNHQVLATESVHDYSGRAALSSMAAPVYGQSSLGFKPEFFKSFDGSAYTAENFDSEQTYQEPVSAKLDGVNNGFSYYSDNNITDTYVASAVDPHPDSTDRGYPFARTSFYNDGRPKESSGVGYDHRMKADFATARTSRTYYGSVADEELLRVLGNEAPDAGSVHKVMTIDANKTVNLTYVNKAGQTLFTCLSEPLGGGTYSLIPLASQATAAFPINETVVPLISTSDNVLERRKTLLLPIPTDVNITYNLTTNVIEDYCADFCTSCDYELFIEVINLEDNSVEYTHNELINPTATCDEVSIDPPFVASVSLDIGNYQITQRLVANNLVTGTLSTQLETHLDDIETSMMNSILGGPGYISADLYNVMTYLENDNLEDLYYYLDGHPNATLLADANGDEYYDFSITDPYGDECRVIKIQKLDCPGSECAETATEFTDFITDNGLTAGMLTYEYAQGMVYTYTFPEFQDLIRNMELGGDYTWCQLWGCWRNIVLNHENSLQLEADLNSTPQGADYEYNAVNSFIDCARATAFPNGDFPLVEGTDQTGTPLVDFGYITSAHNYFYYEDLTYSPCVVEYLGGFPIIWGTYANEDLQAFYFCINHIGDPAGGAAAQQDVNEGITEACEQSCEDKRGLFRNEIRNLYHSQGSIIEGDDFVYVSQTIAGSVQWVPDYGDPLFYGYIPNYSLAEIECAVDILVESCKENCTISGTTATATEQQNIQNVLTGSFDLNDAEDGSCLDFGVLSIDVLPELLITWDRAENSGVTHTASEEAALIDLDKDYSGHIALLAGNKVTKYDNGGQIVWSKTYSTEVNNRAIHSVKSINGGYLISTAGYQVARLNGQGNVVWLNDYTLDVGVSGEQLTSSVEINDNGEAYILWYVNDGGAYHDVLAKIDYAGTFNWVYDYDAGGNSDFVKAVLHQKDAGVLIGSVNGTEVYNINALGASEWNADPGFTEPFDNIRAIEKISTTHWAVIGNDASNEAKIYGIESNGDAANGGTPMNLPGQEGYDLAQTSNGNFAILTEEDIPGVGIQFHVTHLAYGTIDWEEHFGSADGEYNPMIVHLNDDAFILGGTSAAGSTDLTGYKTETTNAVDIWEAWTVKFRYHNSDCHPTEFCLAWTPYDEGFEFGPEEPATIAFEPCEAVQSSMIRSSILNQVSNYIEFKKFEFNQAYEEQCLIPENINDEFTLGYDMAAYHYMLYYYDRAGNLIKTVPPQGVDIQVDLTLPEVQNRTVIPEHTHVTDYQYNSLGQMTRSHTPDGGETKFYYDELSRLRFSQDAYQVANDIYSYMKYDDLGRVIESGISDLDAIGQGFLVNTEDQTYPATGTSEWTKSVYNTPFAGVDYKTQSQQFLRNRISYVYNDEGAYTYYSYDPHGNVSWIVQEIPGFDRFSVAYDYDLLSGNVLMVSYNDDSDNNPDKFFHRYSYDGDNRMLTAETSTDKVIWDVDQENTYNSVGIMNRKLTGQDQVQGTDYVSTIQGWLKGINHSSLSTEKDPGQDGFANTVGEDAFGMILNYYEGDYRRSSGIGVAYTNTDEQHFAGTHDLYNGNISSWASRIPDQTTGGIDIEHAGNITGYKYRYDELQRIKNADFHTLDADDPTASWIGTDDYHTEYSFDANGNLGTLQRNAYANAPNGTDMDNLEYYYNHFSAGLTVAVDAGNYESLNNQLNSVADNSGTAAGIEDIEGIQNYAYDQIGRLTSDIEQGIDEIHWTALQKVSEIIKDGGDLTIRFKYDALGNRIAKEIIDDINPSNNTTTYYVRDASGNPMATYNKSQVTTLEGYNNVYKLTEQTIYGSDRVGLFKPENVVVKEVDQDGADVTSVVYDLKTEIENYNITSQTPENNGVSTIEFITEMRYNSMTQVASNYVWTGGIGYAGKNNAVLEDEYGTIILTAATHKLYSGTSNVTVVRDGNGNLVMGSNNIDAYWDGQSIFVKKPGAGSTDYYLMTVNETGELKGHLISLIPGGAYEVTPTVFTIPGNYAQGLAVVDDRSGDFTTQVLALKNGIGTTDLVSIGVSPVSGFGSPTSLDSYAHESVTGNIAISPNGQHLALAIEQEIIWNTGWMTLTFPLTGLIHNDFIDYATVSTSNVHVLGAFARCNDISYTAANDYLYYAQEKSGANGSYRWDLDVTYNLTSNENGALRRGENTNIYVLKDRDISSNNNISRIATPSGTPAETIQSILPAYPAENYLKADLCLQPHIIKGSDDNLFTRTIGDKMYELKDHLGNVRTVVTDRKLNDGVNYTTEIISIADYYPYGMQMPGRQQSSNIYRYGFQGQEKDDEVKDGVGNSVNYKYRMHDPRIGRFFAEDPLKAEYPHNSPYAFSENKVIDHVELEGLEASSIKNPPIAFVNLGIHFFLDKNWRVSASTVFLKRTNSESVFHQNQFHASIEIGSNEYLNMDVGMSYIMQSGNAESAFPRSYRLNTTSNINNMVNTGGDMNLVGVSYNYKSDDIGTDSKLFFQFAGQRKNINYYVGFSGRSWGQQDVFVPNNNGGGDWIPGFNGNNFNLQGELSYTPGYYFDGANPANYRSGDKSFSLYFDADMPRQKMGIGTRFSLGSIQGLINNKPYLNFGDYTFISSAPSDNFQFDTNTGFNLNADFKVSRIGTKIGVGESNIGSLFNLNRALE